MQVDWQFWVGFVLAIVALLALDLGVLHRKKHEISVREALIGASFWIALALAFAGWIYLRAGHQKTLEFLTGYVVEESLSVDNLFVFIVLFRYFQVPSELQHKVLFWGIMGALITRGAFIVLGVELIHRFHWIIYAFGAFLIFKGLTMLRSEEQEIEPERNFVVRTLRRFLPVTHEYDGDRFLSRRHERVVATPLLVALLVVELTDIAFATDSIPAILAISRDPFIVFTSNVFAILGLRTLYFALARMMQVFHFLHYGLSAILVFIGIKMLLSERVPVPIHIALATVGAILMISVGASLLFPKKNEDAAGAA
jgi:TerC family integral membrane protein